MSSTIKKSIKLLNDAKLSFEKGGIKSASEDLKRALDLIGDRYYIQGLLDDTGMNIGQADLEEKNKREAIAFNLRKRALESRLDWLKFKLQRCKT